MDDIKYIGLRILSERIAPFVFLKKVKLYPIKEGMKLPENALDPAVWNVPEGYYAIEVVE